MVDLTSYKQSPNGTNLIGVMLSYGMKRMDRNKQDQKSVDAHPPTKFKAYVNATSSPPPILNFPINSKTFSNTPPTPTSTPITLSKSMEFIKRGSKQRDAYGVGCPYAIPKIGLVLVCMFISITSAASAQPLAPAVFLFGDSLADVGNNNFLPLSIAKADFIHNGVDFPTHKPTGRFSNGKNAADFIAEKLGLSSPPPYLYMLHGKMSNFQTGVNFASGGAGIFNGTDQLFKQSVPLTKQIEYYSRVREQMAVQLGQSDLDKVQSKAVHVVIIGSNDILGYHAPSSNFSKQMNPTQFVGFMVTTIKAQLQRIYGLGGRKFVMIGVGAIGCCPQQRIKSHTGDCNAPANAMSADYNKGLRSVLHELAARLPGFRYTFLDTYQVLLDLVKAPQAYGFKEVKSACCGLGNLNADVPCIPISRYCPNRSEYLFWDLYHPTEAADRFVVDAAFDDQMRYTYPISLRQLVSV